MNLKLIIILVFIKKSFLVISYLFSYHFTKKINVNKHLPITYVTIKMINKNIRT